MSEITRREFGWGLIGTIAAAGAARPQSVKPGGEGPGSDGYVTDVPGVQVGHFTDTRRPTGCTVVLFEDGATAGIDYDGSGPGDLQAVMLQPTSMIQTIWAIVFAGGSSYGLGAPLGAMRYLEERNLGEHWWPGRPKMVMPIVIGAILDDLHVGDWTVRPDAESAYKACQVASGGKVEEGCVGAGAGATVGTASYGNGLAMKSGVGTASLRVGELAIGALMVVNATGDIVDWPRGDIIAGCRRKDGKGFINLAETLKQNMLQEGVHKKPVSMNHTTIGLVATNAVFNKAELTRIAMMANTGAAKVVNPYHTPEDGDQLFAVSTRKANFDVDVMSVGVLAAQAVATAIQRAVKMATSIPGFPAYRDYTLRLG
jgi:L-aminopeptidase/D-esterase-like protein